MDALQNGRRVRKASPEVTEVYRIREQCIASGLPYPARTVDNFYDEPFFWYGKTAYSSVDYNLLRPSKNASERACALPDHWIIDGESKLPAEPKDLYAAYLAYRDLGPERTVLVIAKRMSRNAETLRRHALRWRWDERARAYDTQMEIEARRAAQAVLQDQMNETVQRRHTYLENEWKIVEKAFGVVDQMLNYPVVEQKSVKIEDDGKTIITIWQPGRWTMATVAQLMEALGRIGRLHTGLSTSNAAVKSDPMSEERQRQNQQQSVSEEDRAMDAYASQKAEEAYFAACEEWKERRMRDPGVKGQILTARVA